jgi:hypothetical protein
VPMTAISPAFFSQLIGGRHDDGHDIRQFAPLAEGPPCCAASAGREFRKYYLAAALFLQAEQIFPLTAFL